MTIFRPALISAFAIAALPLLAAAAEPRPIATAVLVDGAGAAHGTARIISGGTGPTLVVDLTGLAPGLHGMHLHAIGSCSAPGFAGAGPHLDAGGHEHGTLNPRGSHLGDLPNVTADPAGEVHAVIVVAVPAAQLAAALFDADGAALVVHAGADDYRTDPAGGSGARIACGAFRPG